MARQRLRLCGLIVALIAGCAKPTAPRTEVPPRTTFTVEPVFDSVPTGRPWRLVQQDDALRLPLAAIAQLDPCEDAFVFLVEAGYPFTILQAAAVAEIEDAPGRPSYILVIVHGSDKTVELMTNRVDAGLTLTREDLDLTGPSDVHFVRIFREDVAPALREAVRPLADRLTSIDPAAIVGVDEGVQWDMTTISFFCVGNARGLAGRSAVGTGVYAEDASAATGPKLFDAMVRLVNAFDADFTAWKADRHLQ